MTWGVASVWFIYSALLYVLIFFQNPFWSLYQYANPPLFLLSLWLLHKYAAVKPRRRFLWAAFILPVVLFAIAVFISGINGGMLVEYFSFPPRSKIIFGLSFGGGVYLLNGIVYGLYEFLSTKLRNLIGLYFLGIVLIYCLLVLSFFIRVHKSSQAFTMEYCKPDSIVHGLDTSVYFKRPLTKDEFFEILSKHDLKIYRIFYFKPGTDIYETVQFEDPVKPEIIRGNINGRIIGVAAAADARDMLNRYNANEPVVYGFQFEQTPMSAVLPFYQEYDQQKHRISVALSPGSKYPAVGSNLPPSYVQEKPKDFKFLVEKLCYNQ